MSSYIALDIGEKRIGVALADVSAPFPAPLTTLEASEHLAHEFRALLKKHHVVAVVVGLPRNQQGERTAQTERVEQIVGLLSIPEEVQTYWQDESLTSVKAETELNKRKKPYNKADIDALAATYILEDFIKNIPQTPEPAAVNHTATEHVGHNPAKKSKKKNPKHIAKKYLLIGLLAAAIVLVGSVLSWYFKALSSRTQDDVYSVVSIKSGSSTKQIATQLEEGRVIRSAQAFSLYVRVSGINSLQAGEYRLSSKQSAKEIAEIIADGKVTTVNILVSPGQRLDQIITALQKDGYSSDEMELALSKVHDHPLVKGLPQSTKLEGYLFPDTYQIGPSTSAEQLVRRMLDNFEEKVTPQLQADIKAQGLTFNQAVILASIVQKEVRDPKVQPMVAQVFLKRLRSGMPLGSDVTYMYVGGLTGKSVDPSLNSPYNTRRFTGLPPTAISNFNLAALEAVARPTNTDYLYFVAGDDQTTHFSRTLDEHEAAVKKYCTKLCS